MNEMNATDSKVAGIATLAQSLYTSANRSFTPTYPWIFVYVLPKEQVSNGIIIPAADQNKTIHEGVVLATWKPFTQEKAVYDQAKNQMQTRLVFKESQFDSGQHVLFPHWAGMAIDGFTDKRFRVIKEEDWSESKDGGIFAEVEYSPLETAAYSKMKSLLTEALSMRLTHEETAELVSLLAPKLQDQFLLVDRDSRSVTLSGR